MHDGKLHILGLGGSDHDASAALVSDDQLIFAVEEERVTRKKYGLDANLLFGACRKYVLDAAKCSLQDTDIVVADEILPHTAIYGMRGRAQLVNHHMLHAASAFYPSGFEESAILVVDNAGSFCRHDGVEGIETVTFAHGRGRDITVLGKILGTRYKEMRTSSGMVYQRGDPDNSLGHFYKIISHACGFDYVARDDYYFTEDGKTMGLAPYGTDRYLETIRPFVGLEEDGQIVIDLHSGNLQNALQRILEPKLPPDEDFARLADLAWAGQHILEESLLHLAQHLYRITRCPRLCLAGGVGLNSVANGKLLKNGPFERIFVPPACGDSGTSIGAALWGCYKIADRPRYTDRDLLRNAYLGREYTEEEMLEELQHCPDVTWERPSDLLDQVVQRVENGFVAWFQGRSEIGPRALGHRSILADPRGAGMKDLLNRSVKHREAFRPFAPAVAYDRQTEFFDLQAFSPFMLMVADVHHNQRGRIPAVTHVDGTARLQSVTQAEGGIYFDLIARFERSTGLPVLLNTSFNVKGEPVVETPGDALRCICSTGIDSLVLGPFLVTKRAGH